MPEPLEHPEIQDLLREADRTRALLASSGNHAHRAALDRLHLELGRLVHARLSDAPSRRAAADGSGALPDDDEAGLAALSRRLRDQPPLSEGLRELLGLLTPPGDLRDPEAMPEEASKVQWASGELAGRLAEAPPAVQAAVLGMLAARARNLQSHLDVDIGPRMALDRLKRYRANQDLPWVAALRSNARPERGSWAEDARAFWELLRPA